MTERLFFSLFFIPLLLLADSSGLDAVLERDNSNRKNYDTPFIGPANAVFNDIGAEWYGLDMILFGQICYTDGTTFALGIQTFTAIPRNDGRLFCPMQGKWELIKRSCYRVSAYALLPNGRVGHKDESVLLAESDLFCGPMGE